MAKLRVTNDRVDKCVCSLCDEFAYLDRDAVRPCKRTQHPSFYDHPRDLFWVNQMLCEVCYYALILMGDELGHP